MLPAPQGESERSFAENSVKLIRAVLLHQFGNYRARIEAQRFSEVDELYDVNPALTDFDAGDDGLRGLQSRREFVLGQAGGFSGGYQSGAQCAMTTRSKSLQSACSQLRERTYNAKIDLCNF
jgi:hypothetical protein